MTMTIKHQPFPPTKKNRRMEKKPEYKGKSCSSSKKRERESRHMIAMNNPFPPRPTLPVNKTHQHAQDGIARRREGSVPHLSLRHFALCVLIVVVVLFFFFFFFYFLSYSISWMCIHLRMLVILNGFFYIETTCSVYFFLFFYRKDKNERSQLFQNFRFF